jgi:uridine kinase
LDQKHQQNIDFLKKELVKVKNLEMQNASIKFFASSQCNDLYLITRNDKKYLARITNWEQNKIWKIKQEEYEKLNFIKDLKIAPISHYYDLGQNEKQIHWSLVDFVEGETVQKLSDKNIVQLAQTLKKLHENTIKNKYGDRWFELEELPYKSYTLKEYSKNKAKLVEKIGYDKLKKDFENINWTEIKQFCLIHNDLKPLNMVENNSEILLIDWEYSFFDIPENDIARFFVENSLTEDQKKLFLENYLPLENLDFKMEILQVFVDLYEFFEVGEDVVEPVYSVVQTIKPFIIAIDGRGGSGKSTLAKKLLEKLPNSQLFETDDFAYDFENLTQENYFWNVHKVKDILEKITKNKTATYSKLDEFSREILTEKILEPNGVIIVEGYHLLQDQLLEYYSLKIWVENSEEKCLERVIVRNSDKMTKEKILIDRKNWLPTLEKYITEQKPQQKADLVISTENGEYEIVGNKFAKLRTGDYLLPVDLEKQLVFVQVTRGGKPVLAVENKYDFPLIGGGREENETGLQALIREVKEESLDRIQLDLSKIKKIGEFIKMGDFKTFGYKNEKEFQFNGKKINIYFYPVKVEELSSFVFSADEAMGEKYDWVDLETYLTGNEFISKEILENQIQSLTQSEVEKLEQILLKLD